MKVGFIGLGTMGAGMAGNLQKAGYELVVHDIRREHLGEQTDRHQVGEPAIRRRLHPPGAWHGREITPLSP